MSTTNKPPQRERADATGVSTCGAFPFEHMAKWKTFATPPKHGDRVTVVFYCPDVQDYNMIIMVWHGWNVDQMEADHYGPSTYPVMWKEAPEYPELPVHE
jgi:hypothetical protein